MNTASVTDPLLPRLDEVRSVFDGAQAAFTEVVARGPQDNPLREASFLADLMGRIVRAHPGVSYQIGAVPLGATRFATTFELTGDRDAARAVYEIFHQQLRR